MNNVELSQYADVKKEIEHIKERIARLESQMTGPRTSTLSDMPKGPISDNDQMINDFIKLEELRQTYVELLENLVDRQIHIETMIKDLEPIERELVRYRYFDGLMWRDVCEKIGYAQRQTFRIHDKILDKLEKMAHTGK